MNYFSRQNDADFDKASVSNLKKIHIKLTIMKIQNENSV